MDREVTHVVDTKLLLCFFWNKIETNNINFFFFISKVKQSNCGSVYDNNLETNSNDGESFVIFALYFCHQNTSAVTMEITV